MGELQTFKVRIKRGDDIKEFSLKEPLWIDDASLQMQCTNQMGELVQRTLWPKRIAAATGMTENEVMKMEHWVMSALQTKWLQLFFVGPDTFLEDVKPNEKESQSNTTSQKPS